MTGEVQSNVAGEQIAMTAVSDLKWWGRYWLPPLFWATGRFGRFTEGLRDLRFIHFAAWTIVDKRLLFVSHYNGGRDEYVTAFANRLALGMRTFWSSSHGFPGPLPVGPFIEYIEAHEHEASMFWSAYPDATTGDILDALERTGHRPLGRTGLLISRLDRDTGDLLMLTDVFEGTGAHFARLVDVPALGLLLVAVHDNDPEWFVGRVAAALHDRADTILPDTALLDGRIKPGLFYSAYDATVPEVQAALALAPPDDTEWDSQIPVERLHIDRLGRKLLAKQGSVRCMHADEIGCCQATMIPLPDRPNWVKHGVLERHGEIPCTLRYSTQDGIVGLAIMWDRASVPDSVSDIVVVAGQAFFFADVEEVARAKDLEETGPLGLVRAFLPGLNPLGWHWREMHNLLNARRLYPWTPRIANPLDGELCSLQAFDHGGTIIRWFVKPLQPVGAPRGTHRRAALADAVAGPPVVLVLYAQVQTDPELMPVDDPTVPWPESLSPLVPVAHIATHAEQELTDGSKLRVRLRGGQGNWVGRTREILYPMLQQIRLGEDDAAHG